VTEWTNIQETISLKVRRCYECGNYWAVEGRVCGAPRCPICAGVAVDGANQRADKAERSARSLRGALTRARRRRRS
jgi:hypothetical protein